MVATHTVGISLPEETDEEWRVCRLHDRMLKTEVVRSRQKLTAPPADPGTTEVCCGSCQRSLAEAACLPAGERQPCPDCGSVSRLMKVAVHETVNVHESVRWKVRRKGRGRWAVDARAGDDYTADLESWGRRDWTRDRERDLYREVIELYDGTRLESTARLRDHHD
jgi:hypothetical protein